MAALSLDDINRIEDPTFRTVALSLYQEMEHLRTESAANKATTEALRNRDLVAATKKRQDRVAWLGRVNRAVKDDLEAALSLQGNALSMDGAGNVVDPMKATLDMLEKGLASMPRLLQTDHTALAVMPHPTDADALSAEGESNLVDVLARSMGCPAEKRVG